MSCTHPNWRSAEWVLRSSAERLLALSPPADLSSFRETIDKLTELVNDLSAPPAVLEALARLEYVVRERERVQARARAVRA